MIGRFAEAEEAALAALADEPDVGAWHVLLARIRLDLDRPADAIGGLELMPAAGSSAAALQVRSQAHRAQGEWVQALAAIDAAIGIEPMDAVLHAGRALALLGGDHSPGATTAARESLAVAESLDPAAALIPYCLALCDLADDDLPSAAHRLDEAIGRDPEWAAAHRLAATVRTRQGMVRLASRHLATAGRLDPRDEEPLRTLRRLGGIKKRRWRRASRSADAPRLAADAEQMLERDLRLLRGDI